jgi:histone-lysine N-methyltransferase SETMAR
MSFQLSREQFRTMILYDWKIGLTYNDSHARLVQAWGDQAPCDTTVLRWFHEFQRNNFSVEDAARPGRPRTSVNEQTIDAVRTIIENDPHSTYKQIEDILGIHSPAIYSIIHDYLKLRKVCARWVPHQLTNDQKQWRIEFCRHSLKRFEEGQSRRVFDIITGDESWFYHYDPETKEQSKVWVSKTDPRPTKVHRNKSSGKRMVAVFFMKSSLIKAVPLETGETLNASWYINTCLPQVFKTVSERRPRSGLRGLILHDDNATPHRAWITNEFLTENHVESYPNPPYSPDLSPCDFFLFPKLKNQLRGIQFDDDNAMLTALEQAIDSLTKEDFQNCFEEWFIRMHKCIDAEGQYFEKIH